MLKLPILALDPELALPAYAHDHDAGFDLLARESLQLAAGGGRALVPTGIALAIPEGYAGLVLPRSGLAAKHGITCLNAPGLIDAGYRGELKVILINHDPEQSYEIKRGDRIAQLVIVAVATAQLTMVQTAQELGETARDEGGFGSSGR